MASLLCCGGELPTQAIFLLVTGEAGDGKSSIINHFQCQTSSEIMEELQRNCTNALMVDVHGNAEVGNNQSGVTKKVRIHPAMVGKQRVYFLDTPGFGDCDIKPHMLVALIEKVISTLTEAGTGLSGVLICANSNNRVSLGTEMVLRYIDALFPSDNKHKWDQVVIVGTKKDILMHQALNNAAEDEDDAVVEANAARKFKTERRDAVQRLVRESRQRHGLVEERLPEIVELVNIAQGRGRKRTDADMNTLIETVERMGVMPRLKCQNIGDSEFVKLFGDVFQRWDIELTVESWRMVKKGVSWGVTALKLLLQSAAAPLVVGRQGVPVLKNNVRDIIREAADQEVVSTLVESVRFSAAQGGLEGGAQGEPDHEYCALFSALIYDVLNDAELHQALNLADSALHKDTHKDVHTYARVMNGADADFRQPCAVSLVGKTLYVAWRGTQSILSIIMDLHTTPICPSLLGNVQGVQVHAGMWSSVEHDFTSFAVQLARRIIQDKSEVEHVVFCGHSLGGGIAQLAQVLGHRSQMQGFKNLNKSDQETQLITDIFSQVTFHCVAFAAPMVLNIDEEAAGNHSETCEFLSAIGCNSTNYVFENDVVPRLPGHVDYWKVAVVKMK